MRGARRREAGRLAASAIWSLVMIPILFLAWSAFRIYSLRSHLEPAGGGSLVPIWILDLILLSSPLLAMGLILLLYRRQGAGRSPGDPPQASRAGESGLRLLVEQMPAVLWSTDERLRFTSSRGGGLRELGLQPDQVAGMSLYQYFNTEDPAFPAIAGHLQALEGRPASFESNWMGEIFQSYVQPLRDEGDERITGTVGVALNVTAARKAQTALRLSEEHLRQSQKMEAVGRLASGVAHDFNNLLTTIAGYTEMAARSVPQGGEAGRCLDEIRRAGEQAKALTRQLLVFSRKQVLNPELLELNAVVGEMEGVLSRILGEDIELKISLRPEAGMVRADQGQLSQVILNLAVNAREAMPGGGKLLIETARTELGEPYASRHTGSSPGTYALLAFSDTGVGMDKATQARLFEPFFTTKGSAEGAGLGLATAYGIVKQSGGNIWVYSEPGQGATFKIYLPLEQEARPRKTDARAPVSTPAPGGAETILLVEDDDALRSILADGLRLTGYKVMEACDGEEALRICGMPTVSIDLLVTDVVMPQMSGRELARRLEAIRPATRVLFMSGYTESAVLQHGLLQGGTCFLQKPFTPGALALKVREALAVRREAGVAAGAVSP